ncbi:MAG: glycosyltransferase family 4 protein [Hyphomicrobium sp.]
MNLRSGKPVIAQIIPELDTGGAELSTIEIVHAIVRAGGRALVLSQGGRMANRIADAGGDFIPFAAASKNPVRMAWNARAIAKIARREGVDLLHARSRAPAWSALRAARTLQCAFVTTYHGAYRETNRAKALYNSVMARGDVVIANSQFTATLIKGRYQVPDDRVVVIYRGVDVDVFDPAHVSSERIAQLRTAWGVPAGRQVVLHAARLTQWKGQSDVIAAAAQLKARFPDAVFVLAGDAQGRDGYREQLMQEISAHKLDDRVKLVGHVADMPTAFAAAQLAIVASVEPEAFGRAAAEAQAMGLPTISTNIGAPPETILAPPRVTAVARTGWLIPPRDPGAIAAAIAEALSLREDERASLSRRARDHVTTRFSHEAMQRSTLAVYDRLLGTQLEAAFIASAVEHVQKDGST